MRLALLAFAILCVSQPANFIRWARAPIEVLGFWRLALAAAALSPWVWKRRAIWRKIGPARASMTALAGALFFIHLWTFVYAVQHTSVARCMILFSTHPLWTGAGAWLFFGEAVTSRLLAAYALAGAGMLTLFAGAAASAPAALAGDASALVSAVTFSAYVLAARRARETLDNVSFSAAAYLTAAALFWACGEAKQLEWLAYPPSTWAAIGALAAVVTLGGHALFTHLLSQMNVNLLSCAKLLEPPLAALGARLAFGEPLTGRSVAAFALVAAGVVALLLPSRPSAPAESLECP
jgi:drug/metabolite transporter (DMT)-like permease